MEGCCDCRRKDLVETAGAAARPGPGFADWSHPVKWRFTLLLAALAVLAAGVVLARQITYGAGLEGDSVTYISTARSLLAGEGFVRFDGMVIVHWPPLYPLLLAAATLWVWDPIATAGLVNAAAFGLTVFFAGRWLGRRISSRFLAVWAVLAIALSVPLTYIAYNALSETVFILFALLALIAADAHLRSGRFSHLLLAAAWTALACLTRYPGVAVIGVVAAALLFQPGVGLPRKAWRIAAYTAVAVAPVGVWMARNTLLTGYPAGGRGGGFLTIAEALRHDLGALAHIALLEPYGSRVAIRLQEYIPVFPGDRFPDLATLAVGAGLLALAVGTGYGLLRPGQSAGDWLERSPLHLCGGFACVYIALMMASQALTSLDLAGVRFMTPVCIPLTLAAAFLVDRMGRWRMTGVPSAVANTPVWRAMARRRNPLYLALLAALALWLAMSASLVARHTIYANGDDYAGGYVGFARKDVVRYLQDNPIAGRSYSNEHIAMYFMVPGLESYDRLEFAREWLAAESPQWTEGQSADVYIVWFSDLGYWPHTLYEYGADDLRALPGVETAAEFTDGVVFRKRAGAPQ